MWQTLDQLGQNLVDDSIRHVSYALTMFLVGSAILLLTRK